MKTPILYYALGLIFLTSCGGGGSSNEKTTATQETTTPAPAKEESSSASMVDLSNKGIGPVTSLTLGELDQAMADEGQQLFSSYCVACHKAEENFIGPAPKDILKRRSPEWIMNMILNPQEMTAKDPIAIKLLEEANGVPMIGQGLTEEQARKILEYFRTI